MEITNIPKIYTVVACKSLKLKKNCLYLVLSLKVITYT